MEPEERIRELESELQELKSTLQALSKRVQGMDELQESREPSAAAEPAESPHPLIGDVRDRVQRVLRGDSEESIESHIGTVWLSRLATFVTMTAVAVGARATFMADVILGFEIGPQEKTGLGFLLSFAFVAYGLFARRRTKLGRGTAYDGLFAEAVLGCGLAGVYFVTYAALFIPEMRIFQPSIWALIPLFLCLALLAVVSHWQKSQTVAGIAFLLAYYTVVVSGIQDPTFESLLYALLTCAGLALATVLFHFAHPWTLLSWAALVATHGTYIWFFVLQDPASKYGDALSAYGLSGEITFFWLSNAFLYLCFVSISLSCIINAWKTGEFRKQVAPMAGVNSAIFFCLTWFSIREHYIEYEWLFRGEIAVTLFLFALMASWAGPPKNYLFQVFAAKAIIMLTLALQASLSGEKLLVALAIEALGLGMSYHRSGIVIFKVLGLLLSGLTFVGTIATVRGAEPIDIYFYTVPANWFSAVGVSAVFAVIAWYYEHFPVRVKAEDRKYKAQWLLADTVLDVHPASYGIIHAAAASLLLLTITILDLGEHPALPYLLMGEGVVLAVLGVLSRTPQLDVASVLLLAASHVCFHIFLWMPMAGFERQPYFALLTVVLAAFTYVGAFAWERYLRRIHARTAHPGGRRRSDLTAEIEHQLVASLPYLLATFLLTTLLSRILEPLHVPAAQAGLGALLLAAGYALRLHGVKGSGVLAALIASGTLYMGTYWPNGALHQQPLFLVFLSLYLVALACSERLFHFFQDRERGDKRVAELSRTGFVVLLVLMGTLALIKWNTTPVLTLALLALGLANMGMGVLFRESRYRWAALAVMSAAVIAAFLRISINDSASFISFAAAAGVLLATSWAYSRGVSKRSRKQPTAPGEDKAGEKQPHG